MANRSIGICNRPINQLFGYVKNLCKDRDSLSLFVEYIGDYNVRIHRQYYNHDQFSSFLFYGDNNQIKIDLKDSVCDVHFKYFLKLLNRLVEKEDSFVTQDSFYRKLKSALEENYPFETDHENEFESRVEEFLNKINDVFTQYYFSISDKTFHEDEAVYSRINTLIELIDYNPDEHYEDFRKIDRPEIEEITDNGRFEIRIYNVGQANCSALIKYLDDSKTNYKVIMVFDFGFQKKNGKNSALEEMISKIDSQTTILISHFDSDHINNIANHTNLSNRWIFPNYEGKKKRALKTFQVLMQVAKKKTLSGTVYRFPIPFNLSPNISIHQYTGVTKGDSFQSTLMNSQCLVCKISANGKDILIPADALYEEFGDELVLENKQYDYIIVPHHGCEYVSASSAITTLKIRKIIGEDTVGYVMCGKNTYGHANEDHLSWFKNSSIHMFYGNYIYDHFHNAIAKHTIEKVDYHKIVV